MKQVRDGRSAHGVGVGVAAQAKLAPAKAAVITPSGRVVSFGELDTSADQIANLLSTLGVDRGQKVLIAIRNRPEFLAVMQAVWRLGAVVVPIPHGATVAEIGYYANDSGAKIAVLEDPIGLDRVKVVGLGWLVAEALSCASKAPAPVPVNLQQLVLPYTSGTTGRPRAVVRPLASLGYIRLGVAIELVRRLGMESSTEVHLCLAPLHHAQARAFTQAALDLGQTVVLCDQFDPIECQRVIERHSVSWLSAAPVHLSKLLAQYHLRSVGPMSTIRAVVHSAAPINRQMKQAMTALFPNGGLWEVYGATEATITLCSPNDWASRPGTVGTALPGRRIHIVRDDDSEAGPGEVGQVYVELLGEASIQRFAYHNDPVATDKAWVGDRFTLGDTGFVDSEGFLFITGRLTDTIITGGSNVSPVEVEDVLTTHPAVADVAVIGVPDDTYGEVVAACVVASRSVNPDDLIRYARASLSRYKSPRRVEFFDKLPRDANGKLRRRILRERLGACDPREVESRVGRSAC